jgi:leader peptidase (prepilin peptidase)/N-methyltransferase
MNAIVSLVSGSIVTFVLLAAVLGLVVGSFLNVVVLRLPVMLERKWRRECAHVLGQAPEEKTEERFDLVVPGSTCPHCGHAIRAWENIPVLSFLWQRGKCAACGQAISWRYPAVELLTGALTAVIAWHFGFAPAAFGAMLFTWTLMALSFIDAEHQILPDSITLPFLWFGLCVNLAGVFTGLSAAVLGAVSGYAALWIVYHAFRLLTGKEGMGYGDFKLLGALGAWLGWQQLPLVILLSSLIGAVVGLVFILAFGRDRRLPIPFGPFLCVAGWVAMLWGDQLTRAYLQFARLV